MTPKPYHHGDLRAALLDAGLELLAERDADDLGLREVARRVGVSANAVYRHYSDKESLMRALSAEGLARLYRAQREAFDAAGGGAAGFEATGAAYVRFALANPALFRLVFSSSPAPDGPASPSPVTQAMAFLRENAGRLASSPGEAEVVALQAWSLAHGLAMLILDGQIHADEARVSTVFTDWAGRLKPAAEAAQRS